MSNQHLPTDPILHAHRVAVQRSPDHGSTVAEDREIAAFGCTLAALRAVVEEWTPMTHPYMQAASLMSDAQELMDLTEGRGTPEHLERARQALNRAKWITFTYLNPNRKQG